MLKQEGYDSMGAAFEVYNGLGYGFQFELSVLDRLLFVSLASFVHTRVAVNANGTPSRQWHPAGLTPLPD